MRWTDLGRFALVLTLSAGLAACGDDDPTDPGGDDLTEAEAAVMMEALVEAGGFGLDDLSGGGPAAVEFEFEVDDTAPCPGGGNIHVQGTLSGDADQETGFGSYDWVFTQTHDDCTAQAPSDGSTWTFDGSPNVVLDLDIDVSETTFAMDGVQQGAIAWASGGKNGTCQINVSYSFSGDQGANTFTGTVSGTICGFSVDESIEISG